MTIKGKDLISRISDKEFSEDLIKELEKYEVKKPKTVYDLNNHDGYYYLDFVGDEWKCEVDVWWNLVDEIAKRELGIVHLTKERAEHHARVLNTELAIKKWKRENDNVEFDWEDVSQVKYLCLYDGNSERIVVDWWRASKLVNAIYFSSNPKVWQCINDIGEERIIEWIKWEDNDQ